MAEDNEARQAAQPAYPELYDAFDRSSPIVERHFDAVNADLLAHCPVAHTARRDEEGYWLVSRFEDVRLLGQSRAFTTAYGLHPGRAERWAPEEVEDPLHTPLRRVIDINLSPRVVQAARPALEAAAHRLIDTFVADGHVDAVAQYGRRLAGEAFSIVTGMPTEDTPDIIAWFHDRFLGATAGERQAGGPPARLPSRVSSAPACRGAARRPHRRRARLRARGLRRRGEGRVYHAAQRGRAPHDEQRARRRAPAPC